MICRFFELFFSEDVSEDDTYDTMRKEITKMKAKTILLLLCALLLFSVACSTANSTPEQQPQDISPPDIPLGTPSDIQSIGEGAKTFLFEVTDDKGNKISWNVHTNAETLGEALDEHGFLERDDTGMVSHVNGLRADFFEDGAYWALFIGDDWAMEGVDTLVIKEGVTYAFVYTPA